MTAHHSPPSWTASLKREINSEKYPVQYQSPHGKVGQQQQSLAVGTKGAPEEDTSEFELKRRIFAYTNLCAPPMTRYADNHYLQNLLHWCATRNIFIHPAVEIAHERSAYRDFSFKLKFPVPRHTPLIAVPEELVIGFKEDVSDFDRNALFDAQKETNFFRANHGSERKEGTVPTLSSSHADTSAAASDTDICDFFFYCLGTIVADLVTAQNSQLTDTRADFAINLTRVRTLQNAPYLPENIVFASKKSGQKDPTSQNPKDKASKAEDEAPAANVEEEDCSLADILLQMIRNYINGGPLVGKLDRADLMSAVSICLSHSTPLIIGPKRSIGIIPLVHLFPHGGTKTNSVVIARPDDSAGEFREAMKARQTSAAMEMAEYFSTLCGFDFCRYIAGESSYSTSSPQGQAATSGKTKGFVYVVALKEMHCGEPIHLQAMSPVCTKEEESMHMWQLSCGTAPSEYLPTSTVAEIARLTLEEILKTKK